MPSLGTLLLLLFLLLLVDKRKNFSRARSGWVTKVKMKDSSGVTRVKLKDSSGVTRVKVTFESSVDQRYVTHALRIITMGRSLLLKNRKTHEVMGQPVGIPMHDMICANFIFKL